MRICRGGRAVHILLGFLFNVVVLVLPGPIARAGTGSIDLVYRAEVAAGVSNLFALDVDQPDRAPVPLVSLEDGMTVSEFDASPDGSWLAYLLNDGDQNQTVIRLDVATTDATPVLACPDICSDLKILSDGRRLVIRAGPVREYQIVVDTSADPPDVQSTLEGSWDGRWVGGDQYMFWSRAGVAGLCRVEADGSTGCEEIPADNPLFFREFGPSFSPDGKQVAFIDPISIDENGVGYLPFYVGDVAALNDLREIRLYDIPGIPRSIGLYDGIWYPDGVRFLYQVQTQGAFGLQVFDTTSATTSELLSSIEAPANAAAWSGDGQRLALLLATADDQTAGGRILVYDVAAAEFTVFDQIAAEVRWVQPGTISS